MPTDHAPVPGGGSAATPAHAATPTWGFAHPSRRMPVLADEVVATSQPLAAQAGLDVLARGGNAIDAAIAAAAALTVVEPTSNGIGGDAFALVWDGSELHGLNASGRSPAALDTERLRSAGALPFFGWDAVTVPGAVSAWAALHERFARLPLAELLAPAAAYAEHGYAVGPVTASAWSRAPEKYRSGLTEVGQAQAFEDFAATFLPGGGPPEPGERVTLPDHARTLRLIGERGAEVLHRGELGEQIAEAAARAGAALRAEDLAAHAAEWVTPLRLGLDALGCELVELPPNGQGVAALSAAGILERTPGVQLPPDDPEAVHWQVEAMKAAFVDAHAHVADPAAMTLPAADLVAPGRLDRLAGGLDAHRAGPGSPRLPRGGTVYLTTADREGRMVSFIQSNYLGFGSGIVVPGTGIALQNRGAGFVTDPEHPNAVAGGKRPFHTIIPAFAFRGGRPWLAFGVMGGHMQPQGHLQVLRWLADGANPQAALDAPRWRVDAGRHVALESGWPGAVAEALATRGHEADVAGPGATSAGVTADMHAFGGGQVVQQRAGGGWAAGSDPRKDGLVAGR